MGFDAQKRSPNSHHRWNFASKIVVSAEKSWLVSRLFYFGNGSYRWLWWARLPERLQINQKAIVLSQKDTSGQIEAQFRVWCFDTGTKFDPAFGDKPSRSLSVSLCHQSRFGNGSEPCLHSNHAFWFPREIQNHFFYRSESFNNQNVWLFSRSIIVNFDIFGLETENCARGRWVGF